MAANRDQLLDAASELSRAFEIRGNCVAVANALFPAKAALTQEQDNEDVARSLQKVSARAPAVARSMKKDVEILRSDVHSFCRPDSSINCFLKMKKAHLFRSQQSNTEPQGMDSRSLSSRVLRSVDPSLRHLVKEEPLSPASSSVYSRSSALQSSSKFKSSAVFTPSYGANVESKFHNSVEKGTTACYNPLFNGSSMNLKVSKGSEVSYPSNEPPPYPGNRMVPTIARRHLPPSVPTDILCCELRNSLQGLPGMYFIDDGVGQLKISKGCSLSAAEQNVAAYVLRTSNLFIRVRRLACTGDKGFTMKQVLNDGVNTLLREYLLDVSNISLRGQVGTMKAQILAVTRVWHFHLIDMEYSIYLGNRSPMDIVDSLYSMWLADRSNRSRVFSVLLNLCVAIFSNKLRIWLTSGVLHDSEEWMIHTKENDFSLAREPPFFCSSICTLILKIGRSLKFVTGDDIAVVDGYKLRLLNEFSAEKCYYMGNRSSFRMFLNDMWLVIAKNVSRRLIEEGKLIDHLRAARKFVLVEDSHFSRELHRSFISATLGLKTTLTQNAASTLFMTALKKSPSSSGFPFKVIIDVMTSASDSPNTSSRMQFIRPLRPVYIPPDICKPVFANTAELYESIFQAIWQIEITMLTLEEISDRLRLCHKSVCSRESLRSFHRQLSLTLHSIGLIVHRLQKYVRCVVDLHFNKMLAHLSDLSEIDAAAEQHLIFLKCVQNDLFLNKSHENININISTILQLADEAVGCAVNFLNSLEDRNTLALQASVASETKQFEVIEREIALDEGLFGSRRVALRVIQATFLKCYGDLSSLASTADYATRCISILRTNWCESTS